jgi:predicted nucleic acid-binding protein
LKLVLDTWVLVEEYKGNPNSSKLIRSADRHELIISDITIAEIMNVIAREYGEKEARMQYALIRNLPLIKISTTETIAENAGLYKTRYRFSLADAFILSTAVSTDADALITGGAKQFNEEWRNVSEVDVILLEDFHSR